MLYCCPVKECTLLARTAVFRASSGEAGLWLMLSKAIGWGSPVPLTPRRPDRRETKNAIFYLDAK